MRDHQTRSQRRKQYRDERLQRAVMDIEGKTRYKNKFSRGNKITLFIIVAVLFSLLIFGKKYSTNKYYGFNIDEFKKMYETNIQQNQEDYQYSKKIKELIKTNNEYSFLQESSKDTGSLIAAIEKKKKISLVAVIGKNNGKDYFLDAYKENMILLLSILFDKSYIESEQLLKNIDILNKNGDIIIRDKVYKIEFDDYELKFTTSGSNAIFSVENK